MTPDSVGRYREKIDAVITFIDIDFYGSMNKICLKKTKTFSQQMSSVCTEQQFF